MLRMREHQFDYDGALPPIAAWGSLVEEKINAASSFSGVRAVPISVVDIPSQRIPSGIQELDRVLGGDGYREGLFFSEGNRCW